MASSSINVGEESKFHSEFKEEVLHVIFDRDSPKYKGVPSSLWTTKCVFLHNENKVAIVEMICHNVSLELVIKASGPLRDTHVTIQISKCLKEDGFPDDKKYSIQA
jgi:hypothetical protein